MKKLLCVVLAIVMLFAESVCITASASANFSPEMFVTLYNQYCLNLLGSSGYGAQLEYICDVEDGVLVYAAAPNKDNVYDLIAFCFAPSRNSPIDRIMFSCPVGYNTKYSNVPLYIATSSICFNAIGDMDSAFTMWCSDYFSGEGGYLFSYSREGFKCYATLEQESGSATLDICFGENRTNHPNEFYAAYDAVDKVLSVQAYKTAYEKFTPSQIGDINNIYCHSGNFALYDYNDDLLFAFPVTVKNETLDETFNVWIAYDFDTASAYSFVSDDER